MNNKELLVKEYNKKSYILDCQEFREISFEDFVYLLFERNNELPFQTKDNFEENKYNALLHSFPSTKNNFSDFKHIVYADKVSNVEKIVKGREFIMPTSTFVGKSRKSKHARECYALVVDLDDVSEIHLRNLLLGIESKEFPTPNIIVNSGSGLHLYFLLDKPVSFRNTAKYSLLSTLNQRLNQLFSIKDKTTRRESNNYSKLSLIQGYRTIGGLTKFGETVRGWSTGRNEEYSLKEINFILGDFFSDDIIKFLGDNTGAIVPKDLEEKKQIEQREFIAKKHIYEFILEQCFYTPTYVGFRYNRLFVVAVFALKCNIDKRQLENDLRAIYDYFVEQTGSESFGENVIQDALSAYDNRDNIKLTADNLAKKGHFTFKGNKRNGLSRKEHLDKYRPNGRKVGIVEKTPRNTRKKGKTNLQKQIEKLFRKNELTTKEIANKLGCSVQYVNKIVGKKVVSQGNIWFKNCVDFVNKNNYIPTKEEFAKFCKTTQSKIPSWQKIKAIIVNKLLKRENSIDKALRPWHKRKFHYSLKFYEYSILKACNFDIKQVGWFYKLLDPSKYGYYDRNSIAFIRFITENYKLCKNFEKRHFGYLY